MTVPGYVPQLAAMIDDSPLRIPEGSVIRWTEKRNPLTGIVVNKNRTAVYQDSTWHVIGTGEQLATRAFVRRLAGEAVERRSIKVASAWEEVR